MKLNKTLLKGSLALLITFNIFNVLNFLYQFSMARLLTVVEYGILASLYSILYIIAIFTDSIQTVITKYSSSEENGGKLKNLFKRSIKKAFKSSLVVFTIYIILSIPLSYLLKISYSLMLFNGLIIFAFFLIPVSRGIMQGRKMFKSLGLNMIIEAFFKLALAVLFVLIGWKVYGALLGSILGASIAFLLSFPALRKTLKPDEKEATTSGIYNYTPPVFFVTFTILVFFSLDILIAKIVFPADVAGFYAIASVLAKTIFIGTQAISRAMFPLSAENESKEKPSANVFANALIILCILILISLLIFFFYPEFLIKIFSGKSIPLSASILFNLAIAAGILSITSLVLLYKLSLGRKRNYLILPIFILVETLLLIYFSKDLNQFSMALITASATFLWGSTLLLNE